MRAGRVRWARVSRRRWLLAALVVAAFAVRLGFFLGDPNPSESAGLVDPHGDVARNITEHGKWFVLNQARGKAERKDGPPQSGLTDPSELDYTAADRRPRFEPFALEMPGAAVLLAAFWKVTGDHDYGYLQVLQAGLDALAVLLVYWCSLSLFHRPRAALLAAAGYAFFLPIAALMRIAHLDSSAAIFTLGIFALFLKARKAERALPWLLAAGAATGAGLYFRPGLVLLGPALGLALFLAGDRRRALPAAMVPTLVALVLLAPWTIRNQLEFDQFIPTRIGVGQNLWEGLGEIPNDFGAVRNDQATEEQVRRARPDLRYGTPEYDDYLASKATRAIRDHPLHWAKVLLRRVAYSTVLLRNYNWIEGIESYSEYRDRTGGGPVSYVTHRPLDGALAVAAQLLEPLLFLIATITVALTWRSFKAEHLLVLAVPVATMLPYLALHLEARYLLSASFAYLLLAALGADLLLERRSRSAASTSTIRSAA